jgi:hypothetical protein
MKILKKKNYRKSCLQNCDDKESVGGNLLGTCWGLVGGEEREILFQKV